MVQIIPRAPSFGEEFARNLGAGLSQGIQTGNEYASKLGLEKAKKQQEMQMLQAILGMSGGAMDSGEIGTQLQGVPESQGTPSPNKKFSQEQILAAELAHHGLGGILQNQQQSQEKADREERKMAQSNREFGHKETSKYAENLRESGEHAESILLAAEEAREALATGETGASAKNILYKYLKDKDSPLANLFLGKAGQKLSLSSKAFAGGFKGLFGSKPTQQEFFWYETILPDILKSNEVNESAVDYWTKVATIDLRKQQIYDQILEENDGYRPINIDAQVRARFKPEMDQIINEGFQLYTQSGKGKSSGQEEIRTDPSTGKRYRRGPNGEAIEVG